ncbi:MAG TPA: lamin tail domain-containing protein [Candidatus Paceibacterota bacterium]|nr:lamin tail domain-containing protein [Candidatus Paceibacterota bacterium]
MKAKILLLSAFLFLPAIASASVDITHVEYDLPGSDAGREWVEITNTGNSPVDISAYKFREGGVNHKLTLVSGTSTLAAGASAYIVEDPTTFLSEHAGLSEAIFKSSFSLSNSGETLALVDGSGATETSMTYTAAPKPAPAPKAPSTKSKSTSPSPKSSATASNSASASNTSSNLSYADPGASAAAAGVPAIPPLALWVTGLGGVILLGIAGAIYARMQNRPREVETSGAEAEFQIVEN